MGKKPFILSTIAFFMILIGFVNMFQIHLLKLYYHLLTFSNEVTIKNITTYLISISVLNIFIGIGLLLKQRWSRNIFVLFVVLHNMIRIMLFGFDVYNLPLLFFECIVIALLFTGIIDDYFSSKLYNNELEIKVKNKLTILKVIMVIIGSIIVTINGSLQILATIIIGLSSFAEFKVVETIFLKAGFVFVTTILIIMIILGSMLINYKKKTLVCSIVFAIHTLILFSISATMGVGLYSKLFKRLLREDLIELFGSVACNTLIMCIIYFILSTVCYRMYKKSKGKV